MAEYPTEMVELILLGNLNIVGDMNLEEIGEHFRPYLDCTSYLKDLEEDGCVQRTVSRKGTEYSITDKGRRYWESKLTNYGKGEKGLRIDIKRKSIEHIIPVSDQEFKEKLNRSLRKDFPHDLD